METYRHTQVGYISLLIVCVVFALLLWSTAQTGEPALAVVTVILAITLAIFSRLTVVIRDGVLEVFFGGGFIRRRIPLERIRNVREVSTPWFYGWGIRLTPWGWLWNVSGGDGVELEFHDGRKFRIGSDEAERLAEALRRAIEMRESAPRG